MNILIMSKIFAKSGVGSHIMDLSETLTELGHTVTIMSGTNDHEDFISSSGIRFQNLSFSMKPTAFAKNLIFLIKFINANRIDVVHCHHRICGFYMHIVSRFTGVPFVWSNHLDNIPSDLIHRITTFYGSQAICVSSDLKRFCRNKLRIPENKITVVYNGIRPERYLYDSDYVESFRKKNGIGDKKVIGLFARFSPIKGQQHLINAVAAIPREKLENHVVVLFGCDDTENSYVHSLKSSIEENGLEDKVIFEGFVKPAQALSLSDITVLPSEEEGFPIVSIESAQMKRLHIRTKTAGYSDMSDCCIGLEIGDDKALAAELEAYLSGKDYSAVIKRAYEKTQKEFTVSVMAGRILDIYKAAIDKTL